MGLLDTLAAWKRERELADAAALQQQTQQIDYRQRAGQLKSTLGQFGAETAGQVGPMLLSDNPYTAKMGNQLFAQLMAQANPQMAPAAAAAELAPLGTLNPANWTTQSLKDYYSSGDLNRLQRYADPLEERRVRIAERNLDIRDLLSTRPPGSQIEEAIADEAVNVGMLDVAQAARPEFFGYGFDKVGEAAQEFARRTGSDVPFTTFWAKLEGTQGQLRRRLLGLTQSVAEIANFERLAVKPSDGSVEVVMAKLNAQRAIINRLQAERAKVLENYGMKAPPAPATGAPQVAPDRPSLGDIFAQP